MEGRGDEDIGINNVLLELRVRSLLGRGDDELVSVGLAVRAESQGVLSSTEEFGLLTVSVEIILVSVHFQSRETKVSVG